MKTSVRLVLAGALVAARVVAAQDGSARITPYVGFLASGSIAEGPLGAHLVTRGAPMVGAQLTLPLAPAIGLVGNLGYADSELQAGFPLIGGLRIADSRVLMYDGAVQLRFPSGGGIVPFIEGGAGAIRHEVTVGPVTTTSTNVALVAGGGLDLRLSRGLGVKLMARDHVSRFDFGEAIGVANEGRRAHNWVVGAGITIGR